MVKNDIVITTDSENENILVNNDSSENEDIKNVIDHSTYIKDEGYFIAITHLCQI